MRHLRVEGRKLFCARCREGIVIAREVPAQCPMCGSSTWRCAATPSTPYALTHNDKQFLKSIRVAVDEDVSRR